MAAEVIFEDLTLDIPTTTSQIEVVVRDVYSTTLRRSEHLKEVAFTKRTIVVGSFVTLRKEVFSEEGEVSQLWIGRGLLLNVVKVIRRPLGGPPTLGALAGLGGGIGWSGVGTCNIFSIKKFSN